MANTKILKSLYLRDGNKFLPSIQAGYGPYETEEEAKTAMAALYTNENNVPIGATCLISNNGVIKEIWKINDNTWADKNETSSGNITLSPYSLSVENGTIIIDNDTTGNIGEITYHIYKDGTEIPIRDINATANPNNLFTIGHSSTSNSSTQQDILRLSVASEKTLSVGTYSIPLSIVFIDGESTITMKYQQDIIVKNFSNGEFYELIVTPTSYTEYKEGLNFLAVYYIYKTEKSKRSIGSGVVSCYLLIGGLIKEVDDLSSKTGSNNDITIPFGDITNEASVGKADRIPSNCTGIRFDLRVNNVLVDSETIPITHQGIQGVPGNDADVSTIIEQLNNTINNVAVRVRNPENGETYYWDRALRQGEYVMWHDLVQVTTSTVSNGTTSLIDKYYKVANGPVTINYTGDNWEDYFENSNDWEPNTEVKTFTSAYIESLASKLVNTEELIITDGNSVVAGASGKKGEITLLSSPSEEDAVKLRSAGFTQVGDSLVWRQNLKNKIMFWAGSDFGNDVADSNIRITESPFKVLGDGTVYAKKFVGNGTCTRSIDYIKTEQELLNYCCDITGDLYLDVLHCPEVMIIDLPQGDNEIDKDLYISEAYANVTFDTKQPVVMSAILANSCIGKSILLIIRYYANGKGIYTVNTNNGTGYTHSTTGDIVVNLTITGVEPGPPDPYVFDIDEQSTYSGLKAVSVADVEVDFRPEFYEDSDYIGMSVTIPQETTSIYMDLPNIYQDINSEWAVPLIVKCGPVGYELQEIIGEKIRTTIPYEYTKYGRVVVCFNKSYVMQNEHSPSNVNQLYDGNPRDMFVLNGNGVPTSLNSDFVDTCKIIPIYS